MCEEKKEESKMKPFQTFSHDDVKQVWSPEVEFKEGEFVEVTDPEHILFGQKIVLQFKVNPVHRIWMAMSEDLHLGHISEECFSHIPEKVWNSNSIVSDETLKRIVEKYFIKELYEVAKLFSGQWEPMMAVEFGKPLRVLLTPYPTQYIEVSIKVGTFKNSEEQQASNCDSD